MPQASEFNTRIWLTTVMLGRMPEQSPASEEEWEALQEAALHNGVTALCHHQLATMTAPPQCPDWFRQALKKHTLSIAAAEMSQSHELKQILSKWAAKGILPLLLKGTPLAYTLYSHPYLRERCDTDVLFADREQAQHAHTLLQDVGFQQSNTISGDYVSHQFSSYRIGKGRVTQALDMHWRLNNTWAFANAFSYMELESQAVPVPRLGPHARCLSAPHGLMLACMHRVGNITSGQANRLNWLFDMHLMNEVMEEQDWKVFEQLTLEKGLGEVCKDSLGAVHDVFGTVFPPSINAALLASENNISYRPQTAQHSWEIAWMSFRSIQGPSEKLRWLREHLFPPAQYMLGKYETNNRMLLPILYVRRAFGGLPKFLRRIG
jgi:hypothetical protein